MWLQVLIGVALYLWICALAGSYVSRQRGREPSEGMIFGALFGPLGLIVAACLPGRPRPPEDGLPG